MKKSITRTIRIDKSLFDLVMSCNKSLTFTDVVRNLLTREYSFTSPSAIDAGLTPADAIVTTSSTHKESAESNNVVMDPNITIEDQVDELLSSYAHGNKKNSRR